MDLQLLRNHIVDNDLVPTILESLGCKSIKSHGTYYSCTNPDGNNLGAVNVMLPSLSVINYTRDLDAVSKYHDIFTLVQFYKDCDFFEAVKYTCDCLGISIYHDFDDDIPESLIITRELLKMIEEDEPKEKEKPLSPIPEQILSYYIRCVNDQFLKDGISYKVQRTFELGYDQCTNRITIPIRNYDGSLVGIKGRYFGEIPLGSELQKYLYIEPCNKGQILFGLDKSKDFIENTRVAYVGESEKFVMQLWSYGDCNAVATGGKTISNHQIELLSRICDKVILCLDKDVEDEELKNIADKFLGCVEVYTIVDNNNILVDHESPSDNSKKWNYLKDQLKRIK